MLAAMAEVAAEHGVGNVTVAQVVERASVSRRTFYEVFDDIEDCFSATFDAAASRISRRVEDACKQPSRWIDRTRQGVAAILSFLDEEPFMGRVLVVESLAAGPSILRRRQLLVSKLIAAVHAGREEVKGASEPSALTAEAVVGGALAVLHSRLSEGPPAQLIDLAGPLTSMIVLPYLGPAAARRELTRPLPAPRQQPPPIGGHPLNELHMRLTYRTIRVLTALATNPGSSNRRVADASGVGDQGQMSKLLARLLQLGLIENAATAGPRSGEPNAWTLTAKGWQVQGALAKQAAS
jgi:AcrR family transcriptional regulator